MTRRRNLRFLVAACLAPLLVTGLITSATALGATVPDGPTPVPLPRAAITAAELGVVIAQGDPVSEAIGSYYQQARGIPAANVVRVPLTTGVDVISDADFATLKAEVEAQLPAGVQATLLTWTRPSRVSGPGGVMGITSAMAFGYDSKYAGKCAVTATSAYYDADTTRPWTDLQMRPSMMLGAATLDAAKVLIDRGVSADGTYPTGDGYLVRTGDAARSDPRYQDFAPLPALWDHPDGLKLNYLDQSVSGPGRITGQSNVLFYFTGLWPQLPVGVPDLATNSFRPGAIGDNLTSYGGVLPDGYASQQPATAFLEAGATASYGTVDEPCAQTDKFPRASVVIDQYYRGATLIEAYWKSVRRPVRACSSASRWHSRSPTDRRRRSRTASTC